MSESTFTISRLAKEVELPTSTIRYYEREGLLKTPSRSGGNYRIYDKESVVRIRFIRTAQAVGFKLDDIRMLLEFEDGTGCPCGEVKSVLEKRLIEVDAKMKELRAIKKSLEQSISICKQSGAGDECRVLGYISDEAREKNRADGQCRS
jgi:MerR family mercuric resistance operon transcriptional regulator